MEEPRRGRQARAFAPEQADPQPLTQLRLSPPAIWNPEGETEEGSLFLSQGWEASREKARPMDHVHSSPGQCLLTPEWKRAPGVSWQPLFLPSFSMTHPLQGKSQSFSTHEKDRGKHSMGKGTRRMLLACLIPEAHPWVSASWLAVGNGTCFPSCRTVTLLQHQWGIRRRAPQPHETSVHP